MFFSLVGEFEFGVVGSGILGLLLLLEGFLGVYKGWVSVKMEWVREVSCGYLSVS